MDNNELEALDDSYEDARSKKDARRALREKASKRALRDRKMLKNKTLRDAGLRQHRPTIEPREVEE
jgi:hypothetical protein